MPEEKSPLEIIRDLENASKELSTIAADIATGPALAAYQACKDLDLSNPEDVEKLMRSFRLRAAASLIMQARLILESEAGTQRSEIKH